MDSTSCYSGTSPVKVHALGYRIYILGIKLVLWLLSFETHKLSLFLFFSLQDIRRNELDEFFIKNLENLSAESFKFGLLFRQIVVKYLNESLSELFKILN